MEFAPRSLSKLESSWQPIQQCTEAELAYSSYSECLHLLLLRHIPRPPLVMLTATPVIEPLLLNGLHQLPAVSIYAHFFLRANLLYQQFLKIKNVGQNWSQKSLHMTNGYPSTVNNKNGRSRFEISKSEKQPVETSAMFNQLNSIMQIFKIAPQGTRDGSPIIQTFQIAQLEAKKLFISKQVKSSADDAGHNLSQQYQISASTSPVWRLADRWIVSYVNHNLKDCSYETHNFEDGILEEKIQTRAEQKEDCRMKNGCRADTFDEKK
ncbi:hypothetical protein T01_5378 [Trichinella spiralis]|uniref:Uncharacterized protein n=1 Tax=Trichinella spiralis TaxID=6334 RepID=A0A0V1BAL3_TRISP|nr:hypothetical protein T01_5378 [Trichinella spiralis]